MAISDKAVDSHLKWRELARKPFNVLGIETPGETARLFLRQKILQKPYYWANFPLVVNIDISNYCGQRYAHLGPCEWCFPQSYIAQGKIKNQEMPMEQIEWILRNIGKYGDEMREAARQKNGYGYWDPFLNGEALVDKRLPEILRLGKKLAPNIDTQVFTAGTLTENAWMLCTENLELVHFTVSAPNREIYKLVHRGDQFENVLKTMRYVTENHKPNQHLHVHYVITETNFAYMRDWYDLMGREFPEWRRIFSPLIISHDNQPAKKALGSLTKQQQDQAICDVDPSTHMWSTSMRQPCALWANSSIAADGSLLQCCCFYDPKTWNYGNVSDYMRQGYDLHDYWMERLTNRMNNPLCSFCNLKRPDWRQRVSKIALKVHVKS